MGGFDVGTVVGEELAASLCFHDIAQYGPDADEPQRTGHEAWQQYQASGSGASAELGHYPTAILDVQGVLAGDDRSWDQIQMIHMSSTAGFEALLDDGTRQDGRHHRYAALQTNYSMITYPDLSRIPYVNLGTDPAADAGERTMFGAEAGARRKLNRPENLRPIPPTDPAFAQLFRQRNDAESINRDLDDTMFLRRAHSVGAARQHVNLLGYALMVNSLTLAEHHTRTDRPRHLQAA